VTIAEPVEVLRRWENAGGTWEVLSRTSGVLTVRLCTCTGGEEVDRLTSSEPSLTAYVGGRTRSDE
jgi:hypothetical protein